MKLKATAYLKLATEEWRGKYDSVGDFSEGLAQVELNGKWGYVNKQGEEVVPVKYDSLRYFSEGLAIVKLNNRCGFINEQGEEVVPPKYDEVVDFHEGFAVVRLNDKFGYINTEGTVVVPCKYDWVADYWPRKDLHLVVVKLNYMWGVVDNTTGKELLPCVYNESEIPVKTLEEAINLSNRIKKKYEQDAEGLELTIPEFDWKSWYEQVTKSS